MRVISIFNGGIGCFSFPHLTNSSLWSCTISLIKVCPNIIALTICSSGISLPDASTIITASSVPDTTRSMLLSASSEWVGLITNSPLTWPTLTEPVGPQKGILETDKAADAPIIARISGSFSLSAEKTMDITWTSRRYVSGKSGLMGRSINRMVNVSFKVGLPSLLKKPPGNFPAEYIFSL